MAGADMDERGRVLASIASAQERARGEIDYAAVRPTSSEYATTLAEGVDVVELFIERLTDYKACVLDQRDIGDPAEVSNAIRDVLNERACTSAVVAAEFPMELRPTGLVVHEDHALTSEELDAIGCSITSCAIAMAETGTIVLDHQGGQGRRAITLVPDIHVCLVREDQIRGTVPEAIRALGARPITTWISGPSATSDIELTRVEGVHGPRTLVVVIHR